MYTTQLNSVATEAMRLQNGYAYAVDTRDWNQFATLFTADVVATYAGTVYNGRDEWLGFFIPFHDGCEWTRHEMSNHLVGKDANGVWGVCYGFVEWTMSATPGLMNTSRVIYRDRLVEQDGSWVIARRTLNSLSSQPGAAIPAGLSLPNSALDFADNS
jgi:hypothetical protein